MQKIQGNYAVFVKIYFENKLPLYLLELGTEKYRGIFENFLKNF